MRRFGRKSNHDEGQILKKLDGKVALITGSTRGIGRATALLLAQHGARVVLNYKKSEADATRVRHVLAEIAQVEPLVFRADVTDAMQFRSMVDDVVKHCGTLDILVNNADDDQFVFSDPSSISEEKWKSIIQGALYSVYYGCKYAIEVMKKQDEGRIVNIAAVGDHDCELAAACLP